MEDGKLGEGREGRGGWVTASDPKSSWINTVFEVFFKSN